ncbi:hypothetical protein BASA60_000577 [Batrachochytrium salamandrivorans]|nr:hypothetical protein BASA60_000577 [Batrachochytrium salamandrivorans]
MGATNSKEALVDSGHSSRESTVAPTTPANSISSGKATTHSPAYAGSWKAATRYLGSSSEQEDYGSLPSTRTAREASSSSTGQPLRYNDTASATTNSAGTDGDQDPARSILYRSTRNSFTSFLRMLEFSSSPSSTSAARGGSAAAAASTTTTASQAHHRMHSQSHYGHQSIYSQQQLHRRQSSTPAPSTYTTLMGIRSASPPLISQRPQSQSYSMSPLSMASSQHIQQFNAVQRQRQLPLESTTTTVDPSDAASSRTSLLLNVTTMVNQDGQYLSRAPPSAVPEIIFPDDSHHMNKHSAAHSDRSLDACEITEEYQQQQQQQHIPRQLSTTSTVKPEIPASLESSSSLLSSVPGSGLHASIELEPSCVNTADLVDRSAGEYRVLDKSLSGTPEPIDGEHLAQSSTEPSTSPHLIPANPVALVRAEEPSHLQSTPLSCAPSQPHILSPPTGVSHEINHHNDIISLNDQSSALPVLHEFSQSSTHLPSHSPRFITTLDARRSLSATFLGQSDETDDYRPPIRTIPPSSRNRSIAERRASSPRNSIKGFLPTRITITAADTLNPSPLPLATPIVAADTASASPASPVDPAATCVAPTATNNNSNPSSSSSDIHSCAGLAEGTEAKLADSVSSLVEQQPQQQQQQQQQPILQQPTLPLQQRLHLQLPAGVRESPRITILPNLQPPKLNIKSVLRSNTRLTAATTNTTTTSSSTSTTVLRTPISSPMSATSRLQAVTLSQLISILEKAGYLPDWLLAILSHGSPSNIRHLLKRTYETIRDLEERRLSHDSERSPQVAATLANNNNDLSFTTIREQPDANHVRFTMNDALSSQNARFNRYTDILPFDYNRVRLRGLVPDTHYEATATATGAPSHTPTTRTNFPAGTDYINASTLYSLDGRRKYIAAQGPLPTTLGAFWEMIWEQSTGVIVMLTQEEEAGRIKCHRYWPDVVGSSKRYATTSSLSCGPGAMCFRVQFAEETVLMDGLTIQREFIVKKETIDDVLNRHHATTPHISDMGSADVSPSIDDASPGSMRANPDTSAPHSGCQSAHIQAAPEIRRIRMLHFHGWPDHQVSSPRYVLQMIHAANATNNLAASDMIILDSQGVQPDSAVEVGPMVVHCSAGCGRTGVFCAIDSVLSALADCGNVISTGNGGGRAPSSVISSAAISQHPWVSGAEIERLPLDDLIAMTVNHFRRQRIGSVQTLSQYIFCYDAVVTQLGDWFDAGIHPVWNVGKKTSQVDLDTAATPTPALDEVIPIVSAAGTLDPLASRVEASNDDVPPMSSVGSRRFSWSQSIK